MGAIIDRDRLSAIVESYEADMVETCSRAISFDSSKRESSGPGQPFGPGIAACLEFMLQAGESMGFRARNVDGYAGHLEMGEGRELTGILAHLDVVPAGPGWSSPPFQCTVAGGKLIGRGSIDNKGPAVAALYAMKAVAELGLPLSRRVRLILGTDEESGWECMARYFAVEEKPIMSFTPDGEFPIVVGEKGLLATHITWPSHGEPSQLTLSGGTALNAVPSRAEAQFLALPGHAAAALEGFAADYSLETGHHVSIVYDRLATGTIPVTVVVEGKAAHGSTPENGENAIVYLADVLVRAHSHLVTHSHSAGLLHGAALLALNWVCDYIGTRHDGSGLGVATHHDPTGDLTANVGIIRGDGGSVVIGLDIRLPFGISAEVVSDAVSASVGPHAQTRVTSQKDPIYLSPGHPLIGALSRAYEVVTGGEAAMVCMGGTTYAKAIPSCVAFGGLFPGSPETAHQADEFWLVADMVKASKIFANAIIELAGPEA